MLEKWIEAEEKHVSISDVRNIIQDVYSLENDDLIREMVKHFSYLNKICTESEMNVLIKKFIHIMTDKDVDLIKQEFGDLLIEDPYEFQQIQIPSKSGEITIALTINDELTMVEDIEEASKLLIVRVGTSVYDKVDKKYKDDYKKTLYVFHNDWIMFSLENKELFVVDENYIYQWKEIPEKLIK